MIVANPEQVEEIDAITEREVIDLFGEDASILRDTVRQDFPELVDQLGADQALLSLMPDLTNPEWDYDAPDRAIITANHLASIRVNSNT